MLIRSFAVVCICLLLFSCQTRDTYRLLEHTRVAEKKLSDLVEDCSVIPLETTEDNLILDPTVARFSGGYIYILDRFSPSKSLYVFSLEGKYVGKVGNRGEGPGEYLMPHSFAINESARELYVRDMAKNALLVYSLDDRSFLRQCPVPFNATCFALLDDGHFIWYLNAGLQNDGRYSRHLQVTDLACRPVADAVDAMDFPSRGLYNVPSYFEESEGEVLFHHPFMGDYYRCSLQDSLALQPLFTLRFDGLSFADEDYIVRHREHIVQDLASDHYIQWCTALAGESTVLTFFGTGSECYWGRYDRRTSSGWYVDREHLEDDLGISGLSRPKTIYQGRFVSFLSVENIDEERLPESSVLRPYLSGSSKEGNPFILLYK